MPRVEMVWSEQRFLEEPQRNGVPRVLALELCAAGFDTYRPFTHWFNRHTRTYHWSQELPENTSELHRLAMHG